MSLIENIIKHNKDNISKTIKNEICLNSNCISLVEKSIVKDAVNEKIIKDISVEDVKKEYKEISSRKTEIENIFTSLGADING